MSLTGPEAEVPHWREKVSSQLETRPSPLGNATQPLAWSTTIAVQNT